MRIGGWKLSEWCLAMFLMTDEEEKEEKRKEE